MRFHRLVENEPLFYEGNGIGITEAIEEIVISLGDAFSIDSIPNGYLVEMSNTTPYGLWFFAPHILSYVSKTSSTRTANMLVLPFEPTSQETITHDIEEKAKWFSESERAEIVAMLHKVYALPGNNKHALSRWTIELWSLSKSSDEKS